MQIMPLIGGQTGGTAATDKARIAGDFDRFLTLLTTQLQHQDPLSPLDANQFTSQLVQFSQVEQSVKMNSRLEELLAAQEGGQVRDAVAYVGQTVDVLSGEVPLSDGSAEIFYAVDGEPTSVTLQILDDAGQTVHSATVPTTGGMQRVTWDGRDDTGNLLADGTYQVQVVARDAENNALPAQVGFTGMVRQLSNEAGELTLTVGAVAVPVSEVVSVRRASGA